MQTEVLGSVTHAIRAQNVRAAGEREKRACECSVLSHAREDYAGEVVFRVRWYLAARACSPNMRLLAGLEKTAVFQLILLYRNITNTF